MDINVEKCKNVKTDKCQVHVLPDSILQFLIPDFFEDMVRAFLWPTFIWRCVALQGITSSDKLCPCVPCTATLVHRQTKRIGQLKRLGNSNIEKNCSASLIIQSLPAYQYNTGERKQPPAEIFTSLGEQSVNYKVRKLPGDTVSMAMTSTRVKFWLIVTADSHVVTVAWTKHVPLQIQ